MSLSLKERQQRTSRLLSAHKMYHDYNQDQDWASAYLAEAGHPLAKWYRTVADVFFKTRYCSNASERVLASNASGSETISIHMPNIREKRERSWDFDGEWYPVMYPAHPQWTKWVHAFARSGFQGSEAHMDCIFTSISVKTKRPDVTEALKEFAKQNPWLKLENRYDGAVTLLFIRVNGKIPSASGFLKTIRLLKKLFRGYWLKPLEDGEMKSPTEETPLQHRKIMLGGGDNVVRKPHSILLPLWRLGTSKQSQEHNAHAVDQIKELLNDGVRWNATISQHLSHVLTTSQMESLRKQYSGT